VKDYLLYASDELDALLAHAAETRTLGERVNIRTLRGITAGLMAQALCLRGEYERAASLADESLALGEEIGNVNAFCAAASVALVSRLERGESVDPTPYLARIEQGLAATGFVGLNLRFVLDAFLAAGDLARAEARAESLFGSYGGRLRRAIVAVAYGDVMQRCGRPDRARAAYREAHALAMAIGARSALVGAVTGLAELAAGGADPVDPAAIAEARRVCEALSLRRSRARLDRLVAATAAEAVA